MPRYSIVPIALIAVVSVAPSTASAADMEGRVQSVDVAERTVVLDNGAKVWFSEGVALDAVTTGAEVKVSYEEKDGKPVGTAIEVK
jgi:hypothetical protein